MYAYMLSNSLQPKAKVTIDYLMEVMPGQPTAWYERIKGLIESGAMPVPRLGPEPPKQVVEKYRVKPLPPPTEARRSSTAPIAQPQPEKPQDVVSEATKAKLLELCKRPESAERLVAAERRIGISEERAWQLAYDKLIEERLNLYSKIGYNS